MSESRFRRGCQKPGVTDTQSRPGATPESHNTRMTVGVCRRCGKRALIGPLHGAKGGMVVCIPCGLEIHEDIEQDKPRAFRTKKRQAVIDDEKMLYLDLLEAAIRLTHPDRHPPERHDLAQEVTTRLLALKPWTLSKPPPRDYEKEAKRYAPKAREHFGERNGSEQDDTRRLDDLLQHPCVWTIPLYWCDECRAVREAGLEADRQRRNARQRQLRKWQRNRRPPAVCVVCESTFKGRREDAKYCSAACRQRAHRRRKAS